ncbi:MAG TPA: response regulator [Candidatus Acidoferrum sp.]|nr:response regulator [Candidatus Acidoferrum sp.]
MKTVLIVDDEPAIVQLVRITLETARVRVLEASDAATAIDRALSHCPDLILLDVDLPDLSGLDVCRRLKGEETMAQTKIVMLTAAAQQDDVARGFAAGADQYLTKPFSPLRLLTLVEQLAPATEPWQPA